VEEARDPLSPGEQGGWATTHLPNAVLAEVFVVTEDDNFVGHGCTDAQPILNLKSHQEKKGKRVNTGSQQN
jgi:hypothetical protein